MMLLIFLNVEVILVKNLVLDYLVLVYGFVGLDNCVILKLLFFFVYYFLEGYFVFILIMYYNI